MTVFRAPSAAIRRTALHLENVKFSHTIFALPFAVAGALLAARDLDPRTWLPSGRQAAWIVAAVVAARTAAMAMNRVADAALDKRNPRTASRPIPAGELKRGAVLTLALLASAAFVGIAFVLSPLCGVLSPAVLAVLLGYSWTKRFTVLAHAVLGLALGLAPAGAWLAVRGDFGGNLAIPILLGVSVLTWVAGFDLIYACQDAAHDRSEGLHSIPGKFGVKAALRISAALHAATAVVFAATGVAAGLGAPYFAAVVVLALVLAYEHRIVRPDDLTRVNVAFFTANGWVSVGYLAGLVLDLYWGTRA
jgi:4-hydroxybenzoate polyprenyltransferase